jgi:hypothetical protein
VVEQIEPRFIPLICLPPPFAYESAMPERRPPPIDSIISWAASFFG